MDDRKLQVLRAIVTDYVSSQEPVGSKALVDKHDLGAAGVRLFLEHFSDAALPPRQVAVKTVLEPGDTS